MEPLKNIYHSASIKTFAQAILKADSSFKEREFLQNTLKRYQELEMKDRVRLMADQLNDCLPGGPIKQIKTLTRSLGFEGDKLELKGFLVWPLTQFIESYGLEHFDHSFVALKEMTKKFTAEFAVRPFLQKDPEKVFELFKDWREDDNHHVRRLVSEGTRAHLPWGLKVESLYLYPKRGLDLIAPLIFDDSEYVRKSVANHINDITHFDPDLALRYLKKISQKKVEQKKLVKHASRSLLKKSHPKAFTLNGYNPDLTFKTSQFSLTPQQIKEGERFKITFCLAQHSGEKEKIQLALKIGFPKKNGALSYKIFHLKDLHLARKEKVRVEKDFHFKAVSTRTHYPGTYPVSLLVNGALADQTYFRLR